MRTVLASLLCAAVFAAAPALATDAAVVPKGAEIRLVLDAPISTATAKPGDFFKLRTLEPVVVDGVECVPAGTPATGQVVHAQKAGAFGKAGELILAVRRIDLEPKAIPMHKFEPLVGRDRTRAGTATAVLAGPFAAFVRGGQIVLPAGTEVVAFVAADTAIAIATPSPATAPGDPP